jgi:hypothetical protein
MVPAIALVEAGQLEVVGIGAVGRYPPSVDGPTSLATLPVIVVLVASGTLAIAAH